MAVQSEALRVRRWVGQGGAGRPWLGETPSPPLAPVAAALLTSAQGEVIEWGGR